MVIQLAKSANHNHLGLQGQSYAIPITGSPHIMARAIHEFIVFAKANPQMRFLVTAIGCGNAGWRPDQVAPIFRDAVDVPNITLPKSFWAILNRAQAIYTKENR